MIGIFDSGVGGLAILRELDRLLPQTDILYLADTAAFPYGPKSKHFLKARTTAITRALVARGAQLVVVACNTATVVAISHLRRSFPLPFVGVVPPVKVAASRSAAHTPIYVLLTENTASARKYSELVHSYGRDRHVEAICLPFLARVVEDGTFRKVEVASEVAGTLRRSLGELLPGTNVVLGCTHYVFLRDLLQSALGPGVTILEPSRAVAEQALRLLQERGINPEETGRRLFCCTGDREAFAQRAADLLEWEQPVVERIELG